VRQLIQAVREVVAAGPVDLAAIQRIQDAVRESLPELQRASLCQRALKPGRYLCYKDADYDFVVMLLVWGRGDQTPIHDHGTWGVETVLKSALVVTQYDDDETDPHPVGTVTCDTGAMLYNLPPSRDVHRVQHPARPGHGNGAGDECAVSLHIYGREMTGNRMFVPGQGFRACCLETRVLETEFDLTDFPRCSLGKAAARL
jgi:predicted metal-dependent enzyme (double-stranded beta helix superfamily)